MANDGGTPSIFWFIARRSFRSGRFFLSYGTGVGILLSVALALSGGAAFQSSYPLVAPIFPVVGSSGAIVVFTNDRIKGVLEYLLAYGMTPRRIFLNVLGSAMLLVAVVTTATIGVGVGLFVARGHSIGTTLALDLLVYSVPMSFLCVAFATTVGMMWTSLSSPRAGMNSPIGLIPFVGILPAIITLFAIAGLAFSGASTSQNDAIVGLAVESVVLILVVLLISGLSRFLRRERLLSPA